MVKQVRIIPAKPKIGNILTDTVKKLRVAAYCRVSTDSEEQASSYEAQVNHYTHYISQHPEWVLAGVFADEGISGTSTKKRVEFNRMIALCEIGEIDMIVTKSISRFARNTVDCLKYIRLLKEHNIPVYFEKENINTMDAKGEILLTIMASLAQQESQSLSQNVKLGLQYRFQNGQVMLNHNRFLGYTKNKEGKLIIVSKEAEVVKRIFREYIDGASLKQIKDNLERDGIRNGAGNKKWHTSNILQILTNEKYMGDALLQKTYTIDFLNKKRIVNDGTVPQYYVEDSHEAIIPKDIFMQVQLEKSKRSQPRKNKSERGYSSKYALSNCVKCGYCGNIYRRITWNNRGKKEYVWRCLTRVTNGPTSCGARTIKEPHLENILTEVFNELLDNKSDVLRQLEENILLVLKENTKEKLLEVEQKLEVLQKVLIDKMTQNKSVEDVMNKIDSLQNIKNDYLSKCNSSEQLKSRSKELKEFLNEQNGMMLRYDDSLVKRLIDTVTVLETGYQVKLKSGVCLDTKCIVPSFL